MKCVWSLALCAVLVGCHVLLPYPVQPALPPEVDIAPGTFTMGSPVRESCREQGYGHGDETQHNVVLTRGFAIGATETTQDDYQRFIGVNPSGFSACGPTCPVESVSWHEAAAYCNALSSRMGLIRCYDCRGIGASTNCTMRPAFSASPGACPGYRLPTEAEWEYAYRAGTTSALYNGPIAHCLADQEGDPKAVAIAWFGWNAAGTPHPVGQKQPNAWGLHDMAGNVYEWCHDWFEQDLGADAVTDPGGPSQGAVRVLRGGAWNWHSHVLRAAYRFRVGPGTRANNVGFRCVRSW